MEIKNYILILTFIFSISLIYADSNGIWNLAQDLRGGVIGADEQTPGMNYTFVNNVYFGEKLFSLLNPFSYFIDIDGRTQLNDLASNSFNTNKASINGNLNVKNNLNLSGDLKLIKIGNCPGRLYTNSNGDVLCGVDNVNDADNDSTNELQKLSRSGTTVTLSNGGGSVSIADNDNNPTNELQNLNSVLTIGNNAGNNRIVNVTDPMNNQDVATKNYVDTHKGITSETDPQVGATTYGKWCKGTGSQVSCDQDAPSTSIQSGMFIGYCYYIFQYGKLIKYFEIPPAHFDKNSNTCYCDQGFTSVLIEHQSPPPSAYPSMGPFAYNNNYYSCVKN